ncbi:MAG: hypothetical protein COB98_09940 [Flavobacteriaceae bacterium]|nr:MAG: hypothetical protein COB98_09940 [Flavobacteriaceae bacterium]
MLTRASVILAQAGIHSEKGAQQPIIDLISLCMFIFCFSKKRTKKGDFYEVFFKVAKKPS